MSVSTGDVAGSTPGIVRSIHVELAASGRIIAKNDGLCSMLAVRCIRAECDIRAYWNFWFFLSEVTALLRLIITDGNSSAIRGSLMEKQEKLIACLTHVLYGIVRISAFRKNLPGVCSLRASMRNQKLMDCCNSPLQLVIRFQTRSTISANWGYKL